MILFTRVMFKSRQNSIKEQKLETFFVYFLFIFLLFFQAESAKLEF